MRERLAGLASGLGLVQIALFAAGFLTAALLAACVAWVSYLVGRRFEPQAPASARLAAAMVVAAWLLMGSFWVLAFLHAFRVWIAVPLWAAAALFAHRRLDGRAALEKVRADLRRAGATCRNLGAWRLVVGVSFVLPLAKTLRGLAAPPLAWDALTYHLVHAARWVQAGGFVGARAPDAWGYYAHFPTGGETFWAWAMLPVHGDALLAPAGLCVWIAMVFGAYGAGRALGASARASALAGAAVGSVPALRSLVTSGYVDQTVAALFVLAAVFVVRTFARGGTGDRVLAVAALVTAAAVKISAAPIAAVGAAVIAVSALRARRASREIGIFAALALVGFVPYARAWVSTGSPFYPIPFLSLPHNEEFRLVHLGASLPPGGAATNVRELVERLLWGSEAAGWPHINLGLGAPLLVLAGLAGAWRLLRRRDSFCPALFLLAAAALNVALFLSSGFVAWRTFWWSASARLLGVAVGALAVLGAAATEWFAEAALSIVVLASAAQAFPLGFVAADARGIAVAAGVAAGAAIAVALAARRFGGRGAAVAAALAIVVAAVPLHAVRGALRYPIYRAAASSPRPAFDLHEIYRPYAAEWPLWEYLDRAEPARIAVTAGWDNIGHNWFLYPLFGSRLQNTVVYVPVTRDGSILDYRERAEMARAADYDAWLRHLLASHIDDVVLLPPLDVVEAAWLQEHPERFELVATGERGFGGVYRVRR